MIYALSSDDGATWSEPAAVPRDEKVRSVIRHPIIELEPNSWLATIDDRTLIFHPSGKPAEPFGDGRNHGLTPIVRTPKGTFISGAGLRSTDGGIDWEAVRRPTASLTGWPEYQVSKLANVLFSAELARRLAGSGVTTGAVHPGVVASDIWRSVPWPIRPLIKLRMISSEDGARTTLHCATSAEAATQSGLYYDACRPRTPSERARDETLARELWSRTERWVA